MSAEVSKHVHLGLARATVSMKRTYKVAQYENVTIEIGLSDDARPNESAAQHLARVRKDVQGPFEEICLEVEGKRKGGKYGT